MIDECIGTNVLENGIRNALSASAIASGYMMIRILHKNTSGNRLQNLCDLT